MFIGSFAARVCLLITSLFIMAPLAADPPPWAPAHGYDKCKDDKPGKKCKNKHKDDGRYTRSEYPEYGPYIDNRRCNRAELGAVLGGIIGGVAGSQVGKGDGKTVATIAGTVIGILVGRSIGRSMDEADQACTGQALEYAPDRQTIRWHNPDSGTDYLITPTRTWQARDGRYCRDYETQAVLPNGTRNIDLASACREADARWRPAVQ